MTFGEAFVFFAFTWAANIISKNKMLNKVISLAVMILMGIVLLLNVRLANICYLKEEILQSQAVQYYTALISDIRETDGYTSQTPVVYIGEFNKKTTGINDVGYLFEGVTIEPYNENSMINDYVWKETMRLWCGYYPSLGDSEAIKGDKRISDMPCYPDKGSIALIDGSIVVKFSEE
jgi:hypothetical protein